MTAALVVSTRPKASSASTAPSSKRLLHRDRAAGDRPLRGALDVPVEFAVGHVVDAAAGAAHEDGAQR